MESFIKFVSSKHFFRNLLAFYCVTFGFAYLFCVTFMPIPAANVRHADTALGFILGVGLATVIAYYFGSSKGSSDNAEALRNMQNGTESGSKTTKTTSTTTDTDTPV